MYLSSVPQTLLLLNSTFPTIPSLSAPPSPNPPFFSFRGGVQPPGTAVYSPTWSQALGSPVSEHGEVAAGCDCGKQRPCVFGCPDPKAEHTAARAVVREARPGREVPCPAVTFTPEQAGVCLQFPTFFWWRCLGVGSERRDWLGWESDKETDFGGEENVDLGMDRDTALSAQGIALTARKTEARGQRERACPLDKAGVLETLRRRSVLRGRGRLGTAAVRQKLLGPHTPETRVSFFDSAGQAGDPGGHGLVRLPQRGLRSRQRQAPHPPPRAPQTPGFMARPAGLLPPGLWLEFSGTERVQ